MPRARTNEEDDAVDPAMVNAIDPNVERTVVQPNTGRPNDNKIGEYAQPNSTFATRAKRQASAANKAVQNADNK